MENMVNIKINGMPLSVPNGSTILEAAPLCGGLTSPPSATSRT